MVPLAETRESLYHRPQHKKEKRTEKVLEFFVEGTANKQDGLFLFEPVHLDFFCPLCHNLRKTVISIEQQSILAIICFGKNI